METATLPPTVAELSETAPAHICEAKVRLDYLRFNASRRVPLPVCPKCVMPFDPADKADLMRGWCCNCELSLMVRYVNRLKRRWGRAGALIKLQALARVK
jgi:hypothetical protein